MFTPCLHCPKLNNSCPGDVMQTTSGKHRFAADSNAFKHQSREELSPHNDSVDCLWESRKSQRRFLCCFFWKGSIHVLAAGVQSLKVTFGSEVQSYLCFLVFSIYLCLVSVVKGCITPKNRNQQFWMLKKFKGFTFMFRGLD